LKQKLFFISALTCAVAALASAQAATPTKVGIIHVQAAILNTKEGKKASEELNAKFAPKKTELEKKQAEIDQLKDKLQKGSATMSDDAKAAMMRDIDNKTKSLQRANEDAQADLEQEEGKVFNELGSKMYGIVQKYAVDNGYAVIIDVSNPQQPVWWASDAPGINITNDVIALYDKANPGTGATAAPSASKPASAPAPKPAATTPAITAPKPAAAPAAPKQ
jgi:outer membrane protein